ncbi:MAG: hypothetical protein K0R14_1940 [Burkholderiales bacterium]|jgi:hypothetical protein|nr:hypothetical protein [Burkholderiales bacterium]
MRRIKSIKFNNHPILNDLKLDFTKADGTIYGTVILAGEMVQEKLLF